MHFRYCETPTKNVSENRKFLTKLSTRPTYSGRVNFGVRKLKKSKIILKLKSESI